MIKGRIWGPDSDTSPSAALSPPLPSQPFSPLYDSYSSASSVEFTDEEEDVAIKKKRKVRGRVLGMVRSFERSGSFSSASDVDEDEERVNHSTIKHWWGDRSAPGEVIVSPTSEAPPESSLPPQSDPFVEEPTVESLLAEAETKDSWGARAWEQFDVDSGVTVKRVEDPTLDEKPDALSDGVTLEDRMPSIMRCSPLKRQQDRRVVTAVFAPTADDKEDAGLDASRLSVQDAPPTPSLVQEQAIQVATDNDERQAIASLAADLRETRSMVDALKTRLEVVETKVTELEEAAANRHREERAKSCATAEVQATPPDLPASSSEPLMPNLSRIPSLLTPSALFALGTSLVPSIVRRAIPHSLLPSTTRSRPASRSRRQSEPKEPSSMSELPHYMLLVGLGVCVVVLRVVLKKAAARRL